MPGAIPTIEVADYADALCVRRPDSKRNSLSVIIADYMCAKFFVNVFMLSFRKQMEVKLTEYWERRITLHVSGRRG